MNTKTLFIYDKDLIQQCDKLPTMLGRASMVHELHHSCGLLSSDKVQIAKITKATDKELQLFHTIDYVEFLKSVQDCTDFNEYDDKLEKYGLAYDCPMLEECYDFIKSLAGGSSTCAKFLIHGFYKMAINWCGGWHHAKTDRADGFCYVNDIVIAIKILSRKFAKILYIDLDAHHGDGVENTFRSNKNVMTLFFHNYMSGFYPGAGSINDVGSDTAKYYALNVPFLDGISNNVATFLYCICSVVDIYEPTAIVVQCGADILNGDPVGNGNITLEAMGGGKLIISKATRDNVTYVFGGYNFPNTARYWTYLTSIIIDESVSNDIPDDSEYFTNYRPSYEL